MANHVKLQEKAGLLFIYLFIIFGFLYLTHGNISFLSNGVNEVIQSVSLPLLSFIGLYIVVQKNYRLLFHRWTKKDSKTLFIYLVLTVLVGVLASQFISLIGFETTSNPETITQTDTNKISQFLFLSFNNIFQLLGEEFLAILPFLGILQFAVQKLNWTKKKAVLFALFLSSLIFGLFHLPTYQWNWAECILVVGSSRVLMTASYVKTKNIWVSYLVHFIYDALLFSLTVFI